MTPAEERDVRAICTVQDELFGAEQAMRRIRGADRVIYAAGRLSPAVDSPRLVPRVLPTPRGPG